MALCPKSSPPVSWSNDKGSARRSRPRFDDGKPNGHVGHETSGLTTNHPRLPNVASDAMNPITGWSAASRFNRAPMASK